MIILGAQKWVKFWRHAGGRERQVRGPYRHRWRLECCREDLSHHRKDLSLAFSAVSNGSKASMRGTEVDLLLV